MSMSCQILIVDDEPFVLKSLSFVFEKEGYAVETARDGEEGLRKVRELRPRVVLLDVMMPKKNGFEVCSEIREDICLRDVHIIMLTATGQEADIKTGYDRGADDYIIKPFSIHDVLEKIKNIEGIKG